MAAATVVPLSKDAQKSFLAFYSTKQDGLNAIRDITRSRYERLDLAYQREVDKSEEQTRAAAANKAGDTSKFQNVVVPVVMPQVEAATVYQTSVFLTGIPLFGVVAAPSYMDEAVQLESIIDSDATRGGWTRELIMFFRDGFKYNFAPLEVDWSSEVTTTIETDVTKSLTEGVPKEILWQGNRIRRLDPYNTFVDTSVPPTEVYKKGEFAGYTELMSRIQLKTLVATLPDKITANIPDAFASDTMSSIASSSNGRGVYIPKINPEVDGDSYVNAGGTNWMQWAGLADKSKLTLDYKDQYEVTTLYCKVLPSEFNMRIPKENTPQIFKLLIVNHSVIIYCERQTNAHNYLPILIGQPLEDGLGYQTKSLAKNAMPFQEVATAYMSANIASKRRAISDRVLYDPSRIDRAHINSANPSAKIPVRPAAYGKNIGEAVYAFPYRDDQTGTGMQQVSTLLGLANTLNGQNQASQGQFVKGNKTLSEYENVMQNANGRDQLSSILLESQVFTPMKLILKLNTLQYQGGTTIYNREKDVEIEVDPVKLRKAVLNFKISDGLTPASKLISGDSLGMALQVLGSSPQIASGYNVAQLFSYLMKTQGAKITEFEKSPEQQAYEQAMGSWQQLAMQAIDKGIDVEKLPPQPKPQDYGYNPKNSKPAPEEAQSPAGQDKGAIA